MSPASAIPTKVTSRLLEEFEERWAAHGKRAKNWKPESDKIQDWSSECVKLLRDIHVTWGTSGLNCFIVTVRND